MNVLVFDHDYEYDSHFHPEASIQAVDDMLESDRVVTNTERDLLNSIAIDTHLYPLINQN